MDKINSTSFKPAGFKPAWWLPHPHLQTLWSSLPAGISPLKTHLERLELPDGDFLDLAWYGEQSLLKQKPVDSPLVLILCGLTGDINSYYVRRILGLLTQNGHTNGHFRCIVLQYRGSNGIPNRLPRSYHSGETGDLQYVVKLLKEREPNTPLFAIGYSLGGNILLKWLGETGKNNLLHAAIAVSVPFEVGKCSDTLNKGFSQIYQKHLLKELCLAYQKKFQRGNLSRLYQDIKKLKSLREFDEKITAPLHGFKNADDYYTQSSSRQYLGGIQIPSLIIHSKDDPFTPPLSIPDPKELPPQITYLLTKKGGHLGFISGKYPWRPEYWLDKMIVKFLHAQLEN